MCISSTMTRFGAREVMHRCRRGFEAYVAEEDDDGVLRTLVVRNGKGLIGQARQNTSHVVSWIFWLLRPRQLFIVCM
jgi:hypothetical protein